MLKTQNEQLLQRIKSLQQSPSLFLKCWAWKFPVKLANISIPTVGKYGMICSQCKNRLPKVADFSQTHMCSTKCDARGISIRAIRVSSKYFMMMVDQIVGYEAMLQTAQVFPLARRMQPFSPKFTPKDCFSLQYVSVTPITKDPLLGVDPHFVTIPDLQSYMEDKSIATETGPAASAFRRLSQPTISVQLDNVHLLPVGFSHFWFLPTQTQSFASCSFFSLIYLKDEDMQPPLHPQFPYQPVQSKSSWAEATMLLFLIICALQKAPEAEKAQLAPHWPWSTTGVTLPAASQSISTPSFFDSSSFRF